MNEYAIHQGAAGRPGLVLWHSPDGWELDDGTWVRELEVDADLIYKLEEEVAFWERSQPSRSKVGRLCDLQEVAKEILRNDLRRFRHPTSVT